MGTSLRELYLNVDFYSGLIYSEKVETEEIPADMQAVAAEKRRELIEPVSDVDDELAEAFLSDEPISYADLEAATRRATIARKFIPVFMGSAFKNKGVQPLLDGVLSYLPNPLEVDNFPLDQSKKEDKVKLSGTPAGPMVSLAFKLEERQFGQFTYLRYLNLGGCILIQWRTFKKLMRVKL